MCEEDKCGHMNKDFGMRMHHQMKGMKGGHYHHDEMNKGHMMKKMFMKKIMEQLSDEDKKKLFVAKMDMKISMAEKKAQIMKDKSKLVAAKMDMKAYKAEQKIELFKMIRDMLKE
jgi:hypothetical protein